MLKQMFFVIMLLIPCCSCIETIFGELNKWPPEIIQVRPNGHLPWELVTCPKEFCDPSPIFKIIIVHKTNAGHSYKLTNTLYPANSMEYQELLKNTNRKRRCVGKAPQKSECEFVSEFVLFVGEGTFLPERFISIGEEGYDELHLDVRFSVIKEELMKECHSDKDLSTEVEEDMSELTETETEGEESSEYDYMSTLLPYLAMLMLALIGIILLLAVVLRLKKRQRSNERNDSEIELQQRRQPTHTKWQETVHRVRSQHLNSSSKSIMGETDVKRSCHSNYK